MTKDEALRMALEALEQVAEYFNADSTEAKTITALRERLAQPDPSEYWRSEFLKYNTTSDQPEQEPVARVGMYSEITALQPLPVGTKLYTTPQPAVPERKPLTDEEICRIGAQVHGFLLCNEGQWGIEMARAIEAAHGITGEQK